MKTGLNEQFFEGLYQQMRKTAAGMAGAADADDDLKKLTLDEKLRLWDQRDMPVEKEWELHRAVNEDGSPMYSPRQIGLMVFKNRERIAKSGGNIEPKEFIKEANRLEKLAAARRSSLAPPPDMTQTPMTTTGPLAGAGSSLPAETEGY